MRYLLLTLSLMGGFLSFNSFADTEKLTDSQCQAKPTLKNYSMSKWAQKGSDFYAAYQGCIYLNVSKLGFCAIGDMCLGDWEPVKAFNPSSGDSDTPDTKPDNPDVKPPAPDVKPPEPDKPKPPSGSYVSEKLAAISRMTPDMLYTSFRIDYDKSDTLYNNEMLAKAFLQKLSNVTPPSYYAVDHIQSFMDDWQKTYSYLRPSGAGPYYLWNHSRFVSGEHRFTGTVVLAVNNCSNPDYQGNCPDVIKPLDINDPKYASLSDYRNGITRCDRNPLDSSCNSDGGDDSGSGDSGSGGGGTDTGDKPSSCPSGQFNVPGKGCMPVQCPPGKHPVAGATSSDFPVCLDDGDSGGKPDSCPPGSHHEPGTLAGSCTTDLNPNPGGGGGSGSGSTDSNDNGDVVAAINAFHADNNKNHRELMDDLNKKPADPDYTGMEGEFSSMVGGAMSGITDSVKSAWDAGKAAFGEGLSGIDSMLPDIKTSFDLPPGFEAASTGRCIPVVLDFDIELVGIPDYHFHAVGTQVCLLYDKYIRPVLNFCMVILSFFVIHRLLIRSAEFLTDGRH